MSQSRREFIQNGLSFISLGLTMPTFLMRAATAAEGDLPAIPKGKILVVIEMTGGNDGLNTVIPHADANYLKMRPNIGIPANDVVKISSSVGLHPNLKALGELFEKGQVSVLNGVGYPNPNRSHFHSMDIWQTGNPNLDTRERTGWMARYFDAQGHYQGNPLSGITLGGTMPLALWKQSSPVSVIGNVNEYGFGNRASDKQKQLEALRELYAQGTVAGGNAEFIRNVGAEAYSSSEAIKQALKEYDVGAGNAANYPNNNGLANNLRTIARLISGGIGTRIYYTSISGFDTHANQPRQHANLMSLLAEAVAAFQRDLTAQGRDKDVLLMTFSEFGRRVRENGSAGTDHGAAGPMLVIGSGVKGGIEGEYPSLTDLEDGDLKFHTDFRSVYTTVLDKWLGTPAEQVLGGNFPLLKFI